MRTYSSAHLPTGGSKAIILAATNNSGQLFSCASSLLRSCHEDCGPADRYTFSNKDQITTKQLLCYRRFSFTLYTMRSCSPSLRVVPSYLMSLTKDKANIFSDLSLAVGEEKETQPDERRCLHLRLTLLSRLFSKGHLCKIKEQILNPTVNFCVNLKNMQLWEF